MSDVKDNKTAVVRVAWFDARYMTPDCAVNDLGKFERSAHDSLFGNFGVPRYAQLNPTRLVPTPGLYQRVNRSQFSGRNVPSRPPFEATGPNGIGLQINSAQMDVFPGRVAVSQVTAKFSTPYDSSFLTLVGSLKALRSPKLVPLAMEYFEGMANTAFGAFPGPEGRQKYFVAELMLPERVDQLTRIVNDADREAVAALIGADDEGYLNDEVVKRVFAASAELNAKSSGETLLLNRQGAILIRARGRYRGPHRGRFDRLRELATIGLYARTFLRESHFAAAGEAAGADQWIRKIEQWVSHSRVIFDTSVSNTVQWEAISSAFLLRERLDAWHDYHAHDAGLHMVHPKIDPLIEQVSS